MAVVGWPSRAPVARAKSVFKSSAFPARAHAPVTTTAVATPIAAEAVYGDECFTRIYEGSTGEVLYSAFRTSCTWFENPVIADPDGDSNTEILIGSNANCARTCPAIDPIHRGNRCEAAADSECNDNNNSDDVSIICVQ